MSVANDQYKFFQTSTFVCIYEFALALVTSYIYIDLFWCLQYNSVLPIFLLVYRDFDSRLYLCLGIFGFLTLDTFERLTQGLVFPLYLASHLVFFVLLVISVLQHWRWVVAVLIIYEFCC